MATLSGLCDGVPRARVRSQGDGQSARQGCNRPGRYTVLTPEPRMATRNRTDNRFAARGDAVFDLYQPGTVPYRIYQLVGQFMRRPRVRRFLSSFVVLMPPRLKLSFLGIVFQEDLCFSYWPQFGGDPVDLTNHHTSLGLLKDLVDALHFQYISGRQATPYDGSVLSLTFYPKLAFVRKGQNRQRVYPAQDELEAASMSEGGRWW